MEENNIDFKKNCLNLIRLIAAFQVMYFHVLTSLNVSSNLIVSNIMSFFYGVPIFFVLSGFLIWQSIGKSEGYQDYLKKRFLRIYPELWCGIIFEIITIIVFYKEKINIFTLLCFTLTQGTFFQFWTPADLRGYGCGTPNGALWTICVIIQFYILVYFLYKLIHKKNIKIWLAFLITACIIYLLSPFVEKLIPNTLYKLYNQTIIPYSWMFIFGAFLSEYKAKTIIFLKKYWSLLLGISIISLCFGIDVNKGYGIIRCITLTSGLIGFAYSFVNFHSTYFPFGNKLVMQMPSDFKI